MLAKEPNFRWCLRPSCGNGQLYEISPRNPRISCEECNFRMCFQHQVPWHERMTCDEYESRKKYGDPEYQKTQEWITGNAKLCPNPDCRTPIQKNNGCFHMTCKLLFPQKLGFDYSSRLTGRMITGTLCRHEFCWECLTSREEYQRQGQEGHKEGCFFRTNSARPTELRGSSLEEALQRSQR
jgi:IBR domain, a half RING-finger domain